MKIIAIAVALALPVSLLNSYAQDPRPTKSGEPPNAAHQHKPGGFHILPPRAMEHLNLTAEQRTQLESLESDVKQKLEQILTHEQLEKLKQMRPPKKHEGENGESQHQGAPCEKPAGPAPGLRSN